MPTVQDLCKCIAEEIAFRTQFDKDVFAAVEKNISVNPYKYVYNMRAEQLAFWKKLQYHHQVFVEKYLTSFSIKIACNSSTKHEEALASHSIHSKFYSTDEKVIHPRYALV